MDVMVILGLRAQNTKKTSDFEEQNQNTHCLLKEPEWRESLINPQCMLNDIGQPCCSTPPQHDDMRKDSQEQNAQLIHEMKEQEKIILDLKKKHKKAVGQFEQHTANLTCELEEQTKKISDLKCQKRKLFLDLEVQIKRIFDLECQKGKLVLDLEGQIKRISDLEFQTEMLVRDLEEQTSKASALEKRDAKIKEVFSAFAGTMLSELEYQEELISQMSPDDGKFLLPSHNTLVHLVEIIEQWTADDEDSDMMFDLEDEPQFEQLYTELLSRFNEQSCKVKIQAMKLDDQKSMIDEQNSAIFELETQKRKLAGDLEEQNEKVALLLDLLRE
ncbi:hypothetical protein PITC_026920 [Penicillium italicum]|uniref:Uncharacterized protein n=1 Tax=Penicillium italicum TaxID=40296 RepID=A0A0A2KV93_PENIT|nr:hypothetical protein PITC_026920 [Penicillium italicum]